MKKWFLLFLLLSSIIFVSSCISYASTNSSHFPDLYDREDKTTILFSDPSTFKDEHTYYDALLELQDEHPDLLPAIQIIEINEKSVTRHFSIETFPTMLIIEGEIEHLRIEGSKSKEDILQQLSNTFDLGSTHESYLSKSEQLC